MDRILVALPPLPEQHRIVSRVDELMGLCNRLLEMHSERENQRDLLTAASHYLLSNGANADAFRKHTHFFIGHLPHLTMRPEQIKHLRKTILNLAVRGKLIPQDLADEPASELLKRIHAYNVNFVGARGRTREMEIFRLHSDSAPFDIPVSQEGRSGRAKTYDYYGASGVIDKIDGYLFEKPLLLIGEDGANLINRSTPIAFIARGKYWVNNHAHVLDGMSDEFLRFIELYVNATDLRPYVTGTAQPKMNQAKMNSIPVALPPEAEQIRIVARVTELMTLSDRLEGQLATAQTEASRLLESVLHHGLQETLP
jgi:type I restriction enzyme, S subunit